MTSATADRSSLIVDWFLCTSRTYWRFGPRRTSVPLLVFISEALEPISLLNQVRNGEKTYKIKQHFTNHRQRSSGKSDSPQFKSETQYTESKNIHQSSHKNITITNNYEAKIKHIHDHDAKWQMRNEPLEFEHDVWHSGEVRMHRSIPLATPKQVSKPPPASELYALT